MRSPGAGRKKIGPQYVSAHLKLLHVKSKKVLMILFAFHLAPFAFQDLDKEAYFGAFSLLSPQADCVMTCRTNSRNTKKCLINSAPNDPGLKSSRKWNLKVIAIKLTNEQPRQNFSLQYQYNIKQICDEIITINKISDYKLI